MDSTLTALALAGFLLARAIEVLSNPQTPDMMPVAFVARGEVQQFVNFEGKSVEEMISRAKQRLARGQYDAWAFAYEGFIVIQNERRSAIFVHSWRRGLDSPVVLAQTWVRDENGIYAEFDGPAVRLSEGSAPWGEQQSWARPVDLDEKELRVLAAGIQQYEEFGRMVPAATQ